MILFSLVSCLSVMRGENSRQCAPGSCQLSATKVKEADSDQGGAIRHHGSRANNWQKYELCSS